ncbi:hemolysin III [Lutibacter sp. Hel_I_33_5]|uniref:PAQR family membrane homeostasis protein TrhA n=1 Tax=Lutibacter sp. Hel_I_33_5 TaxID=1566289 RepID=UPI0011A31CCC|nr:hemolysin III family protein [Lutibacter sp. Hel_I_33_5]TVZ56217.1 hemolysin III [Lutibacter sp. Hel_I_33_5]
MTKNTIHRYSKKEEYFNVLTHAFGLGLGILAFPFLVYKSFQFDGFWKPFSFIVYGLSIIILYAASTFYHASKEDKKRRKLNIFDHAAIYVLIAGTYTPFTLIILEGRLGWILFIATWIFAFIGIILKLFFTGRYDKLSTAMYLLMGWQVIFAIKPLLANFFEDGVFWLFLGGIFYTIGAILYSIKKLSYNHAIFHVFVLLGSLAHFISIYFYI